MTIQALVADFRKAGGHWPEALDPLMASSPHFVRTYVRFAGHAWREGPLPLKVKGLVSLALHASMTTLHAPGVRHSCRVALEHGATQEELLETLELISVIGVHACVMGMPSLVQQLKAIPGRALDLANDDPERARIKSEFRRKRGYWSEIWDGLLALDPGFFEAFTEFSSVPWEHGVLDPKTKEFMYIAVDVSANHMYTPGIHVHVENALKYGATPEEILEVMQLASSMGISTFETALPIVLDEIARARKPAGAR